MRRLFTYFLAAGLFAFCLFSKQIIPQNISYGLMSTVKRNAVKDKKEIYEDMKAVVQNGLIMIELYSNEGELVETLKKPEDFTDEIELVFTTEDMTIKTVSRVQLIALP